MVMNADSCFHHSQQARRSQAVTEPTQQLPVPQLPDSCLLEFDHTASGVLWIVRDTKTKKVFSKIPEKDIRFSVSCKFHIFHDEEEILKYESNEKKLTAENIIEVLIQDLKTKKKLPDECDPKTMPLYKLAPILVKEYISPLAPTSADIQAVWQSYFNKLR